MESVYIKASTQLLIVLIFVVLLILYYFFYYDDVVGVYSNIDGKKYSVRASPIASSTPLIASSLFDTSANVADVANVTNEESSNNTNNRLAANFLAILNQKITTLVDFMYINNLPDIEVAQRLKYKWTHCRLRETNSNEDSIAYTVNKGEEMRVCIRQNDKLEDLNTAIFVILHELAHIMSVSYGHNEEFRENFNYIVHLASKLGIYIPQNFQNEPVNYCGTDINTTPCSDGSCSV